MVRLLFDQSNVNCLTVMPIEEVRKRLYEDITPYVELDCIDDANSPVLVRFKREKLVLSMLGHHATLSKVNLMPGKLQ